MRRRGFTLIELLVVITIMGVVLSLVAPLTVDRIDKMKARTELAQLKRTFAELSVRAYAIHQPLRIDAVGTRLTWQGEASGQRDLEHLFFARAQRIDINANGIAVPDSVRVMARGAEQRIALNRWLEADPVSGAR